MSFRTRMSVLSVILVVLIVAYVLGTAFSPQARRARAANQPLVASFEPAEVSAIEIVSPGDDGDATRVELRRAGAAGGAAAAGTETATAGGAAGDGDWAVRVGERFVPARDSRIESLFDAVSALRTVRTVTENPDLYEDFEIGEDNADRIILLDGEGNPISISYFGKAATQGNRIYARTGEGATVYLTQNTVGFYFEEDPEYFAELAPLPRSLSGSQVQRISIAADISIGEAGDAADAEERQRRVANFTVFRNEDGAWEFDDSFTLPDGDTIDQRAVDRWASNIVDFEAASHATDVSADTETGLDDPSLQISISTEQGREYELSVGNASGPETYYLRASGPNVLSDEDGEPYLLTGSLFGIRRLFRAPDDL